MTDVRVRRTVLLLAGLALLWSLAVSLTGGFVLQILDAPISSRDAARPLLAALVFVAFYVARYRQHWRSDIGALAYVRWPQTIAGICTALALIVGIHWGTFMGTGPDASGYVSEADLFAHGKLTVPAPEWAKEARWGNGVWSSAPVGYRPGVTGDVVPTYPPGLPLMMAFFELVAGRDAVFYVVPLLGVVVVWASYMLGRYLCGAWAGAIAAMLMVSSPTFLKFVIQPMSDVAVTACWATALVFAWRGGATHAIVAGIAAAAALLVRPNLAPLAAFPAMLLWTTRGMRVRRLVTFGLAVLPAAIVIATLNSRWWGSPLRSSYGTLESLYSADRILPNVRQYVGWLVDTQTPLVFLGFAAPWFLSLERTERPRVLMLTVAYPIGVLTMYATYLRFDDVSYLRFLLPAFPPMLAALGAVCVEFVRKTRSAPIAAAAVAAVIASMTIQSWRVADREGTFRYAVDERRFATAVDFANSLPANAILISNGYSGTLRFYSGRDILRWEVMLPNEVDAALADLRRRGHPLYLIGDGSEFAAFTALFSGRDIAANLEGRRVADAGEGFVAYDLSVP
jgi:hypothetical protein